MLKIMTPGPTQVRENVRLARSKVTTNPDLDLSFYDFYKETCDIISQLFHTKNETFILSGEGILGLEAACASLTEPGDRVLVLNNGIFGKGFADFVKIYGGNPVLYTTDYKNTIDVELLRTFLEQDHNFKYATIVHCDTPSGVINDVSKICPVLKEFGILTVVDSVSGMFGEHIDIEDSKIDIACGGSQKALSAPIGLTFVTVSQDAMIAMEKRKTPIASFYANLLIFKDYYKNKWFPYSMPISDIYGLRKALENVVNEKDIIGRHKKIAEAVRAAIQAGGLSLYLESGYGNTVTVIEVPKDLESSDILSIMKEEYGILIAGCFDVLAGKVIRIGHMGENANVADVADTLDALTKTLQQLGRPCLCNMKEAFLSKLNIEII
jgi:aspartate aminotransferase-like enzyme